MKNTPTTKKQDLKNKFVTLRSQGKSFADISEQLSVDRTTLIDWSREQKTEIANLRSIEREALREKHGTNATGRIELLGYLIGKAKTELDKRDLSNVPTPKLMDFLLRAYKLLEKEQSAAVVFQRVEEIPVISAGEPYTSRVSWGG